MVGPVFATTPYRSWLVIRYNFCVRTKTASLSPRPDGSPLEGDLFSLHVLLLIC
jgi:hypothetical protein